MQVPIYPRSVMLLPAVMREPIMCWSLRPNLHLLPLTGWITQIKTFLMIPCYPSGYE